MTEQNIKQDNETAMERQTCHVWQMGAGGAIVLAALALAWGAWRIPAQTAQNDGGAALLPTLCAAALLLCGGWLVWDARHGGWRNMAASAGQGQLQITPWVWVSAGMLLGALLIRHSGFVLAAALCYVLALQGLRRAAQPDLPLRGRRVLTDVLVGLVLAALVYVLFVRVLGVSLPAGWLPWM